MKDLELIDYAAVKPGLPTRIRIWSSGREWHVDGTTTAIGPKPGGGTMVADISRFHDGDKVRVQIGDGMDYTAWVGGKP